METVDIIKFMDSINTIMNFIESALRMDEIVNFGLEDTGDVIKFFIRRGNHNIQCEDIVKVDEDSLKVIYASIAAKYSNNMNIGATSTFKNGEVTWNLAPVIGENTLVEFISNDEKDQKWFHEEIVKDTKEKGLK